MRTIKAKEIDLQPIEHHVGLFLKILTTVEEVMREIDSEVRLREQYFSETAYNIRGLWPAQADRAAMLEIHQDIAATQRALKMLLPSLEKMNIIVSDYIDRTEKPVAAHQSHENGEHGPSAEEGDAVPAL